MIAGAAAMPGTTTGFEPLDATLSEYARGAGSIFVPHAALEEVRDGGDPGMRMKSHTRERRLSGVKDVQKHERLEYASQVGGTHQSSNRSMCPPSRPMNDRAFRVAVGDSGFCINGL